MGEYILFPKVYENTPAHSSSYEMFNVVPIRIQRIIDKRVSCTHWHDYLQIWYTVSGHYIHTVNGVSYKQSPGSLMLIFPYMKHSIDSSQSDLSETTVISISVRKGFLEEHNISFLPNTYNSAFFDSLRLPQNFLFSGAEKKTADTICLDLLAEYKKRRQQLFSKMLILVTQLLELCISHSDHNISRGEIRIIQNRIASIDEAMRFLSENFTQRITLNDVCVAAMMSKSSFTPDFYTTVGQSCKEYITGLRMRKAAKLLYLRRKSISEIAQECGFYDSSHFRLKCTELYGVTPLHLRKEVIHFLRDRGDYLWRDTVQNTSWAVTYSEERLEDHKRAISSY